jgi:hypothetical protein
MFFYTLQLEDRGSISGRGREFSFCHLIQNNSGVHPATYQKGTVGSFPDGKAAEQ